MAYLPLEKKPLIQSSYVRFRELVIEIPQINKQVTVGQFAHWGGLAVVILYFVRALIGYEELPDFVGGAGLLALVFGWAYKSDQRTKQKILWTERQMIQKQMDEIGVYFSYTFDRVTVYSGSLSDENIVSPLSDGSYRESV